MTQTQTIEEGIVQMVAMILAKTLTSATKSTGRDINNEFVDDLTVMLVTEMYTMLKAYGEISHMPPQNVLKATVEEAMIMLGQMLKRQLDVEQQQKEHDEAQGGGQPQGAPQGPPQPQGQPAPAPQGGALGM